MGRIGRKDYDKEPLPPSMWREYLKPVAYWLLMSVAGLIWLALIAFSLKEYT
jgi:hypothetical protein